MTDIKLDHEVEELLSNLARALPKTKYLDDGRGNLKYEHTEISPYVKPILRAVGLTGWKYTVWMWHSSFKWASLPGCVYIIPICNISDSARSEPGGALKYGVMRRIDGNVVADPKFAAIFAVEPTAPTVGDSNLEKHE